MPLSIQNLQKQRPFAKNEIKSNKHRPVLSSLHQSAPVCIYSAGTIIKESINFKVSFISDGKLLAEAFFSRKFLKSIYKFYDIGDRDFSISKINVVVYAFFSDFLSEMEDITGADLEVIVAEVDGETDYEDFQNYYINIGNQHHDLIFNIVEGVGSSFFTKYLEKSSLIEFTPSPIGENVNLKVAIKLAKSTLSNGAIFKISNLHLVAILDDKIVIPLSALRDDFGVEEIIQADGYQQYQLSDTVFAIFAEFEDTPVSQILLKLRDTFSLIESGKIESCHFPNRGPDTTSSVIIHEAEPYLVLEGGW